MTVFRHELRMTRNGLAVAYMPHFGILHDVTATGAGGGRKNTRVADNLLDRAGRPAAQFGHFASLSSSYDFTVSAQPVFNFFKCRSGHHLPR